MATTEKPNQKIMKYEELLNLSPAESAKAEIPYKVREAKLQLDSDILSTERSLSKAEEKLRKAKGSFPYNSQNIITAEIEVEMYTDGLKRLNKLLIEQF